MIDKKRRELSKRKIRYKVIKQSNVGVDFICYVWSRERAEKEEKKKRFFEL